MQEHEQALVDAIARLADASDGESGNKYVYILDIFASCCIFLFLSIFLHRCMLHKLKMRCPIL
jgi:hypothetical protein